MPSIRHHRLALRSATGLLSVAVLALTAAEAQAAPPSCKASGAAPIEIGTVADVPAGSARSFVLALNAGDSVIADLDFITPQSADGDSDEGDAEAAPTPRGMALCNAQGERLAPLAGEVFDKGGSVAKTDEGERLRFVAQSSGRYTVAVSSADQARELLVRRRPGGASAPPVVSAALGAGQSGNASSGAPMVFAFTAPAGQWVELKSTSEKDTVLRLAGPDRAGDYSVIAENDDSDGLNPIIRRRLPMAGTYYVQVDSLSDEPGEFQLALNRIEAPKPPPPPAALRPGATISGRLADGDDARLYALSVVAGRTYRLELTAPYDGVVGIGLPNPVEPDGGDARDAGFAEVKSQDSGTTGTERLTFTARNSGQLLVRVKSFGIGESDGAYTLVAKDLGG